MKFSDKFCENFKKLGIKKKQEKFWENFAEFMKKFPSANFIENTAFLYSIQLFTELNTAFLVWKPGNTDLNLRVSNVGSPVCDNKVWVIKEWVTIIFT